MVTDALLAALFLRSQFFLGGFGHGHFKLPDEIQINLNFLHPFPGASVRGMNQNFLHKFMDHRGGQLGEIRIFLCQRQKVAGTVRVLMELVQLCLLGGKQLFQLGLFLLIFGTQQLEPFFFQFAHGIGFIQLFNQHIQLGAAPALLGDLAFQLLCRFLLANL